MRAIEGNLGHIPLMLKKRTNGKRKHGWSRILQSAGSELDLPLLGHQAIAFEDGHLFITSGDLFPEIA